MGGLDCEVDVVESVDTAVETEGAVSAAWKARCRRYRAATGRGHARPHDPGERLACGSPHAGIPPGADAYRRFNRPESVAIARCGNVPFGTPCWTNEQKRSIFCGASAPQSSCNG